MDKDDFFMSFCGKNLVLKINVSPEDARPVILEMISEGKLPNRMKAISFLGNPATLLTGNSLTAYLLPDVRETRPSSLMDVFYKFHES